MFLPLDPPFTWVRTRSQGKNSEKKNFISAPILTYDSSFSQLNEGNNMYMRQISLKPIFTPLRGGPVNMPLTDRYWNCTCCRYCTVL